MNCALVKEQVVDLIAQELFSSAESLINLFLASNGKNQSSDLPDLFELYGDVMFAKKDYQKALINFTSAITHKKSGSLICIDSPRDARIRFKQTKCHFELKDYTKALGELETIPSRLMSAGAFVLLGKLYKNANLKKQAVTAFRCAVNLLPTAIEAVESLIELGDSASEVTSTAVGAYRGKSFEALFDNGWLQALILGLSHLRNGDFDKMKKQYQPLLNSFPNCSMLLLQLASCAAISGDNEGEAISLYSQAKRLDPGVMDQMDRYGLLLFKRKEEAKLQLLSHEVLSWRSLAQSAPGWLILAMQCELAGQSDKAVPLVDKAIQLNPKYALAFVVKARILLTRGQHKQAAVAFMQANILSRDLLSFEGLIEANLAMDKAKSIVSTVKSLLAELPRSSVAYELMGKVLALCTGGTAESEKAFKSALKLNPSNSSAASQLADILVAQQRTAEAHECLIAILDKRPSAKLRLQLAKIMVNNESKHSEAIDQLNLALVSQDGAAAATQELDNIEGLMKSEALAEAMLHQKQPDHSGASSDFEHEAQEEQEEHQEDEDGEDREYELGDDDEFEGHGDMFMDDRDIDDFEHNDDDNDEEKYDETLVALHEMYNEPISAHSGLPSCTLFQAREFEDFESDNDD